MTIPEDRSQFIEVEEDGDGWVKRCLDYVSANHVSALSKKSFMKPGLTKDLLSGLLYDAVTIMNGQNMLVANLRAQTQALKTETISCQAKVIKLQEDLLSAKEEQLNALKTSVEDSVKSAVEVTVKTAVEDSVKTEFQTYSEAVQAHIPAPSSPSAVVNQETLRSVVKHVVEEEDRSRNLMVFGLPEGDDNDKQLNSRVCEVFEHLGVKPRVEASRLGVKTKSSKSPRPIKVTLSSSTVVRQILLKARNLRLSDNYESIFLAPDRSIEQRAQQKELVDGLKRKKAEEPDKRHFIKRGQICTSDVPVK